MKAKQVTEGKQNGIFWLRDWWLIIHTCEDKNEEWKGTYISTYEITLKKFIIDNWSFDFLSVLISFKLQLYSIQIKIT